jgi:hypothetical protein
MLRLLLEMFLGTLFAGLSTQTWSTQKYLVCYKYLVFTHIMFLWVQKAYCVQHMCDYHHYWHLWEGLWELPFTASPCVNA